MFGALISCLMLVVLHYMNTTNWTVVRLWWVVARIPEQANTEEQTQCKPRPRLVDNVERYVSSTSCWKWKDNVLVRRRHPVVENTRRKRQFTHTQTWASIRPGVQTRSWKTTNTEAVWCQLQIKVSRWCWVCQQNLLASRLTWQQVGRTCVIKHTTTFASVKQYNNNNIPLVSHGMIKLCIWCPLKYLSLQIYDLNMTSVWQFLEKCMSGVTIFKLINKSTLGKNSGAIHTTFLSQHYVLVITLHFTYFNQKNLLSPWL